MISFTDFDHFSALYLVKILVLSSAAFVFTIILVFPLIEINLEPMELLLLLGQLLPVGAVILLLENQFDVPIFGEGARFL